MKDEHFTAIDLQPNKTPPNGSDLGPKFLVKSMKRVNDYKLFKFRVTYLFISFGLSH